MDNNTKRKVISGTLYGFCALMLVMIICIAIVSAVGTAKKETEKKLIPETEESETIRKPEVSTSASDDDSSAESSETAPQSESEEQNEDVSVLPYEYAMPVSGEITREFKSDVPVFSQTMNDYRTHLGVDISSDVGTPVCAIADGTISTVYCDPFMGNCITVEHGGGMKSYYMGMNGEYPQEIAEGTIVTCGQQIGQVGDSAALEACDAPHLHLEVTVNGETVDPLHYIEVPTEEYEG